MGNITEQNKWETTVYQIEKQDKVLGGEEGKINVQAKQLANRTAYLKNQVDTINRDRTSYAPKASPAFTGVPTAPTANQNTNNTQIATTAFVKTAVQAVNNLAAGKQSPATTLAGYGIGNFKVENATGDLNNYRTDGIYCFGSIGGASNLPREISGNLQVIAGGLGNERWCRQIFHPHYSDEIWMRWQTSGTDDDWSPWKKITDFNQEVNRLFSQSLSESGWCKLPNGLIFQWGKVKLPALQNEGYGVVTLPIAFPRAIFTVIAGSTAGTVSSQRSQEGFYISEQSRERFKWVSSWEEKVASNTGFGYFQWISIGC